MPAIDTSTTAPHKGDPVLDLPIEEQYMLALKPAEVVLNVTEFKDIFRAAGVGKARCSSHTMTMPKAHSRVYLKDRENLHIRPFGATIRLRVTPSNYYPIGIAFVLKEGIASPTKLDRLGLLNFDQLTLLPDKNTLAITDRFKEEGDGEYDNEYEFSVIIQEATTGRLGIIDPMIIHEPR